jgi:hypothetical protein
LRLNRPILQSSFKNLSSRDGVTNQGNAFVIGILRAFQQDLHLILRLDDLWLAILTQFSLFVKGTSEELRKHFVAHDGQEDLLIDISPRSVRGITMVHFAQAMTKLIQNKVIDPDLRAWVLHKFTMTTDNDLSVASIVMMASMQNYFVTHFGEAVDFYH